MEKRLARLKLILDELDIGDDISTIGERKKIQKAIYLAQIAQLDMGYRFGWYLRGPYSPSLTRDYYELAERLATGDDDHEKLELTESVKQRLARIRPILCPPCDLSLPQEDWLELVASIHYLIKLRGLNQEAARRTMHQEKTNLAPHFDSGIAALQKVGYLPTN